MRFLKQFVPVVLVAAVCGQVVGNVESNAALTLVLGLATVVLAVFVYRWTVRGSEHRGPEELACNGAATRLGQFPHVISRRMRHKVSTFIRQNSHQSG